ncbi:MAG: sugar transferase [Desulfitobacteriaceae bacterium]
MLYSESLSVLWYRYFLMDTMAYLLATLGVAYAKFGFDFRTINVGAYLGAIILLGILVIVGLYFSGVYETESLLNIQSIVYAKVILVDAMAFYILSFYIRDVSFSRVFFTAVFPASFVMSLLMRAALIAYHQRTLGEDIRRPFLAYGFDGESVDLLRRLESETNIRILKEYPTAYPILERLAALTETAAGRERRTNSSEESPARISLLANKRIEREEGLPQGLEQLSGGDKPGLIICESESVQLKELVEYCELRYIPFFIVPSINSHISLPFRVMDSNQLLVFGTKDLLLEGASKRLKRFLDIGLAALGIVLTSWLMLAVWVLVRVTSPGKGIYTHVRLGLNGRPTQIYKFRTMYRDAEERLREMLRNEGVRIEFQENFKLEQDPRVTSLGRLLRHTSLDELPQLFNILKGDISLVGPRPIVPEELDKYGEHARVILRVKPGLTGFWQVNGRSEVSYAERIRLDLYYIHHWSPLLDLRILLKTVPVVLKGKGAQ